MPRKIGKTFQQMELEDRAIAETFGTESDNRFVKSTGPIGKDQFIKCLDEGVEEFVFREQVLKINYDQGKAYIYSFKRKSSCIMDISQFNEYFNNTNMRAMQSPLSRLGRIVQNFEEHKENLGDIYMQSVTPEDFRTTCGWGNFTFRFSEEQ